MKRYKMYLHSLEGLSIVRKELPPPEPSFTQKVKKAYREIMGMKNHNQYSREEVYSLIANWLHCNPEWMPIILGNEK